MPSKTEYTHEIVDTEGRFMKCFPSESGAKRYLANCIEEGIVHEGHYMVRKIIEQRKNKR